MRLTIKPFWGPYPWKTLTALLGVGFFEGVPYIFVQSIVTMWAADLGASPMILGMLAWMMVPYGLKILWSPFLELLSRVPSLHTFGLARLVGVVNQIGFLGCLTRMCALDPVRHPYKVLFWGALFAFFGSCQEIFLESYRLRSLEGENRGLFVFFSQLGFRLGFLFSGYFLVFWAYCFSWRSAFYIMAVYSVMNTLFFMWLPQQHSSQGLQDAQGHKTKSSVLVKMKVIWEQAFISLRQRTSMQHVLIGFFLYKLSDIFVRVMLPKYLFSCGYTKLDIANGEKIIGFLGILLGGAWASILLQKRNLFDVLRWWAVGQAAAYMLWVGHAISCSGGKNLSFLAVNIFVNQMLAGIGNVSIWVYISTLCDRSHLFVQSSVLSSLYIICGMVVATASGFFAQQLCWEVFFLLGSLFSLPAFIFFSMEKHRTSQL